MFPNIKLSTLKNDFPQWVYELYEGAKCWVCEEHVSEQNREKVDALHHILGRCSNSPLNAAPVHNNDCHLGNGKLSHLDVKEELLLKSLNYLLKQNYGFKDKDREFLSNHEDFYSSNS